MDEQQIKRAIKAFKASKAKQMTLEYDDVFVILKKKEKEDSKTAKTRVIYSPVVGVVSLATFDGSILSPHQKIKQQDVICVIESMKLLRTITSDVDGVIDEIFIEHLDMVEYNQPLVSIRLYD